ncbi:MAG: DUF3375 domain-containing protein [Spiribacter salinus]|uniref:DUF3375 domain-containing protein n=1 Tax=Spiribacter salinus TaxID=1335746 RepID=A0A540VRN2_9GAMM|nr:MAG: DUF3375 domain-containing protein [Spiribacter salinus]
MDYAYLETLRRKHPAWRLLLADHAPLIISFLYNCFITPNVRSLPEQDVATRLDDTLYRLREELGEDAFPKSALEYLADWAGDDRAWLRKYYPANSDEPHYDLTPATERAIQWLAGLEQQAFIGAESRLKLVFDLLHQIVQGAESDPETRIRDLERRRDAIDREIDEIRAGRMALMDDTQIRERFLQMESTARGLLGDFRQVEQNFRDLDREVRERITTWEGSKGEVLEDVLGERDAITDSDQGRSFRAFWDFLMSPAQQEEFTELLEHSLGLEPVSELEPDERLRRIHYDWLAAGEATQRTVARLSEQLRRYLDDKAWLEDKRIMTLIREVEQHALAVRDQPPPLDMTIDEPAPRVELAMERRLFTPPVKPVIESDAVTAGEETVATDALFEQAYVDRERLRGNIRHALQTRDQISLADLVATYPLEQGLAELVSYVSLATEDGDAAVYDNREQAVTWTDTSGVQRRARLPLVLFTR